MTVTTNLQVPTFDNLQITWDTINFTCDGACLINGGGTDIREAPAKGNFNALTYTRSEILRF